MMNGHRMIKSDCMMTGNELLARARCCKAIDVRKRGVS